MQLIKRKHQRGVTLVELMVGMVVGLIVIAIVGTLFITTLGGSRDALQSMKLNQELRAAMDYIVSDVRRAGMWSGSAIATPDINGNVINPFTTRVVAGATDVSIHNFGTGARNCIVYSYDRLGILPVNFPLFGFRLNNDGVLQALRQANITAILGGTEACAAAGVEGLTDPNTVVVTALTFSFEGSRCLNVDRMNTATTPPTPYEWENPAGTAIGTPACANTAATGYNAIIGEHLLETRQLLVTLTGRSARDPNVTMSLQESVNIRNNRIAIATVTSP